MQVMTAPHPHHRLLAGLTRSRILAMLRTADGPLGVRELAASVGLHPNSVREQLDRLVDGGLVERTGAVPGGRGRPSLRYAATSIADEDATPYRELARVLADELARLPDPATTATAAGQRWGRSLVDGEDPATTPDEALERLVALLDEAGFAPEPTTSPDEPIRLHRCPFGSLAHDRSDVVCPVHLGLMRGALHELGAPLDAVRLEPFVEPGLCLAHLGGRDD
jgi:predicted ArsR family transcriptional regulator